MASPQFMPMSARVANVEEVLQLHPHTGQGLNMGHPTIGRAGVMCRRALVCTSPLANGAPLAVKVGFLSALKLGLSMQKSHVEGSLAAARPAPRFKLSH
jgi:hypothetical protein